ncbi:MAG: hypothetical protein V1724_08775, partial [Chloroflexota bacterium]
ATLALNAGLCFRLCSVIVLPSCAFSRLAYRQDLSLSHLSEIRGPPQTWVIQRSDLCLTTGLATEGVLDKTVFTGMLTGRKS